jgi:hypothetical protein
MAAAEPYEPSRIFRPALFADERHERDRPEVFLFVIRFGTAQDPAQGLMPLAFTDGNYESASNGKLLTQSRRNVGSARGYEDRVERSLFRPAFRAVTGLEFDVPVVQRSHATGRSFL